MNVAYHLNRFGIEALTASSIGNDEKGKNTCQLHKELRNGNQAHTGTPDTSDK